MLRLCHHRYRDRLHLQVSKQTHACLNFYTCEDSYVQSFEGLTQSGDGQKFLTLQKCPHSQGLELRTVLIKMDIQEHTHFVVVSALTAPLPLSLLFIFIFPLFCHLFLHPSFLRLSSLLANLCLVLFIHSLSRSVIIERSQRGPEGRKDGWMCR